MIINIDEKLIDLLNTNATNDAVTPELWIERKINALLKQFRKQELLKTVESDIEIYEPIIVAKKEEIEQVQINEKIAYDLAHPVIEEQATSTEEVIK